jgi:hypothetical protein
MDLWQAMDREGEILNMLVQRRRDKCAALRLMRKLLRKQGFGAEIARKAARLTRSRHGLRLSAPAAGFAVNCQCLAEGPRVRRLAAGGGVRSELVSEASNSLLARNQQGMSSDRTHLCRHRIENGEAIQRLTTNSLHT